MGTNIRAKISAKNEYYISKHRYYELKHFCLQYDEWKRAYNLLEPTTTTNWEEHGSHETGFSDHTAEIAIQRLYLRNCIDLVEGTARAVTDLHKELLLAVTKGYSYETVQAICNVPCCREVWYGIYRRFFWELDRSRILQGI